jgi:membrane protease YdiL (CAAX protease family)
MRKRMGFLKTLFASSVIFAAAHTSASLAVFPISLLLGYVYEKKQSLPANIMLHGLINAFATAVHIYM